MLCETHHATIAVLPLSINQHAELIHVIVKHSSFHTMTAGTAPALKSRHFLCNVALLGFQALYTWL